MEQTESTSQFSNKSRKTQTCDACGLTSWALVGPGVSLKLRIRGENRFHPDRRHTVWCCSSRCAIQSLAVAEMGSATHKWPITLAQFAALNAQRVSSRLDRPETIAGTRINSGSAEGENGIMDLPHLEGENVRKPRRGGRPRKWQTEAQRKRAYRANLKSRMREEHFSTIGTSRVSGAS